MKRFNLKIQEKIFTVWKWCDDNDKSTEFTLQYVSDVAIALILNKLSR